MPIRRRRAPSRPRPFHNQWRTLRREHQLTQREVAHYLGHLNVDYYQDVETGRRFPGERILCLLLVLFKASLHDAYPSLIEEARQTIGRIDERCRRQSPFM